MLPPLLGMWASAAAAAAGVGPDLRVREGQCKNCCEVACAARARPHITEPQPLKPRRTTWRGVAAAAAAAAAAAGCTLRSAVAGRPRGAAAALRPQGANGAMFGALRPRKRAFNKGSCLVECWKPAVRIQSRNCIQSVVAAPLKTLVAPVHRHRLVTNAPVPPAALLVTNGRCSRGTKRVNNDIRG
jgi:hypothetical protein